MTGAARNDKGSWDEVACGWTGTGGGACRTARRYQRLFRCHVTAPTVWLQETRSAAWKKTNHFTLKTLQMEMEGAGHHPGPDPEPDPKATKPNLKTKNE